MYDPSYFGKTVTGLQIVKGVCKVLPKCVCAGITASARVGVCVCLRQARDQYDDAVSSGQQAFLLEESEESSDVFRLSVGCLSPGQNASITIVYIMELSVQADDALRFCLPAVLNPRYKPAGDYSYLSILIIRMNVGELQELNALR